MRLIILLLIVILVIIVVAHTYKYKNGGAIPDSNDKRHIQQNIIPYKAPVTNEYITNALNLINEYIDKHQYIFELGIYLGSNTTTFIKIINNIKFMLFKNFSFHKIVKPTLKRFMIQLMLNPKFNMDDYKLIDVISFIVNMNESNIDYNHTHAHIIVSFNSIETYDLPPVRNFNFKSVEQYVECSTIFSDAEWKALIHAVDKGYLDVFITNNIVSQYPMSITQFKMHYIYEVSKSTINHEYVEYAVEIAKIIDGWNKDYDFLKNANIKINTSYNKCTGIYKSHKYIVIGKHNNKFYKQVEIIKHSLIGSCNEFDNYNEDKFETAIDINDSIKLIIFSSEINNLHFCNYKYNNTIFLNRDDIMSYNSFKIINSVIKFPYYLPTAIEIIKKYIVYVKNLMTSSQTDIDELSKFKEAVEHICKINDEINQLIDKCNISEQYTFNIYKRKVIVFSQFLYAHDFSTSQTLINNDNVLFRINCRPEYSFIQTSSKLALGWVFVETEKSIYYYNIYTSRTNRHFVGPIKRPSYKKEIIDLYDNICEDIYNIHITKCASAHSEVKPYFNLIKSEINKLVDIVSKMIISFEKYYIENKLGLNYNDSQYLQLSIFDTNTKYTKYGIINKWIPIEEKSIEKTLSKSIISFNTRLLFNPDLEKLKSNIFYTEDIVNNIYKIHFYSSFSNRKVYIPEIINDFVIYHHDFYRNYELRQDVLFQILFPAPCFIYNDEAIVKPFVISKSCDDERIVPGSKNTSLF